MHVHDLLDTLPLDRPWAHGVDTDTCTGRERQSIAMIKAQAPTVPIYLGDDSALFSLRGEPIAGLISVMANAWPDKTKKYVERCFANQASPLNIFEGLEQAPNPIPIKAVLSCLGLSTPDVRLPLHVEDLFSHQKIEFSIQEMHTLFN